MSSFVISKQDYVKAAGIVAGLAEASARGNSRQIWIYDYESGRNSTPEDYYRLFTDCYTMNALSVAEQYNDSEPETDSNEYSAEFKAALQTGKKLWLEHGSKMKSAIMELRNFFHSAIYQTENMNICSRCSFIFTRSRISLWNTYTRRRKPCNHGDRWK